MKYLKKYKIFESSEHFESMVNMNLIQDIKDLSLDYLDDGYIISYVVKSIHPEFVDYTLLTGRLSHTINNTLMTSDELNSSLSKWELWTNYKPEYVDEVKESINKYGLTYFFRIYKINETKKIMSGILLSRIRGMYPNEKIEIY